MYFNNQNKTKNANWKKNVIQYTALVILIVDTRWIFHNELKKIVEYNP